MEFKFNVSKLLRPDEQGYALLDGSRGNPFASHAAAQRSSMYFGQGQGPAASTIPMSEGDQLALIIDNMGAASSKAQQLPQTITSASRFFGNEQRLYFRVDRQANAVIGLLKVGPRKLFVQSERGQIREITPLCVFDFYVHESVQRGGHGKSLFEQMIKGEGDVHPAKLAYDRPSPKLIGFLSKHYGLKGFVPQNNNYVVFNQYWDPQVPSRYYPSAATNQPSHQNEGQVRAKAARSVRFADEFVESSSTTQDAAQPSAQYASQQPDHIAGAAASASSYFSATNQGRQNVVTGPPKGASPSIHSQRQGSASSASVASGGLPPYRQARQASYTRQTGTGGMMGSVAGSPGISKQLSNAGLKVLGDASSTPKSSVMAKHNLEQHKENNVLPPGGSHLPPRHPAAKAQASDPVFGARVPRRDGHPGTNDSVGALFGGAEASQSVRAGSRGGKITGNEYHLNRLEQRISSTQEAVEKRKQELDQIQQAHMKSSQSNSFQQTSDPVLGMQQTMGASTLGLRSNAGNDYQMNQAASQVDKDGPTSFGAIYNKRNMHATVNDSFARVGHTNAAQEQISRQRQQQMQGSVPWGTSGYNYDQGYQRKRF